MEITLKIGGIDCRLKTSAALPRRYRLMFGEDLIVDMDNLTEHVKESGGTLMPADITVLEQFCYACHKYGDPTQPDDIEAWLEQFDSPASIYMVLSDLVKLWNGELAGKSTAKKKTDKQPES